MNLLSNCLLLLTIIAPFVVCFLPPVSIIVYYPLGLKACMKHEAGIQEFSFHANLNKNITIWKNADIEGFVTKPLEGYWCFVEKKTRLRPGDVLSYWYKVKKGYTNIASNVKRRELTQSQFLDDYNTENVYLKFIGKVETLTKPVTSTSTTTNVPFITDNIPSFNTSNSESIDIQITDNSSKEHIFSVMYEKANETIRKMNEYSPHINNVSNEVTTPKINFDRNYTIEDEFDTNNEDENDTEDLSNSEPVFDVPDPEPISVQSNVQPIAAAPLPQPIEYPINFKPKTPITTTPTQLDESKLNTIETTTPSVNQNETICLCENPTQLPPHSNILIQNIEKQMENLRLLEFENKNLKADLKMYKEFTTSLMEMYENKSVDKNNKLALLGRSPSSGEKKFLNEIIRDILDIPSSNFTIVTHERINNDKLVFELKTFKEKLNVLIRGRVKLVGRKFRIIDYEGNKKNM